MTARILNIAVYVLGGLVVAALAGYDLYRSHRAAAAAPSADVEADDLDVLADSLRGTWRLHGGHRFPERAIKELLTAYDFDQFVVAGIPDRPERGEQ